MVYRSVSDPVLRDVKWVWVPEGQTSTGCLVYATGAESHPANSEWATAVMRDQAADCPPILNLQRLYWVHETVMATQRRHLLSPELAAVLSRCAHHVCQHAEQIAPTHKRTPLPSELTRCSAPSCSVQHNLWFCLLCGHIGCGRVKHDDTSQGGNGHALQHWADNPSHVLCVKIGTISAKDADVYCYCCETMVQNPYLGRHLLWYGLDRRRQELTAPPTVAWNTPATKLYVDLPLFTYQYEDPPVVFGLPKELFWHILRFLGAPQTQMRTVGYLNKSCHIAIGQRLLRTREVDLSSSKPSYASQFFEWSAVPGLRKIVWRGFAPQKSFGFPLDLQLLDTLVLREGLWQDRGANVFCSLFGLRRLRVLDLAGCDGGLWKAVATFSDTANHDRTMLFPALEHLDISGIPLEQNSAEVTQLLSLTAGRLLGLRIGCVPEMARLCDDGTSDALVGSLLDVTARHCPGLEFFEFFSEPVWFEGLDWVSLLPMVDGNVWTKLLPLSKLRVLLFRPCILPAAFLEAIPRRFPALEVLDLLASSPLVEEALPQLTSLLSLMPGLQVCVPVPVESAVRRGHPGTTIQHTDSNVSPRTLSACLLQPTHLASFWSTEVSPNPPWEAF